MDEKQLASPDALPAAPSAAPSFSLEGASADFGQDYASTAEVDGGAAAAVAGEVHAAVEGARAQHCPAAHDLATFVNGLGDTAFVNVNSGGPSPRETASPDQEGLAFVNVNSGGTGKASEPAAPAGDYAFVNVNSGGPSPRGVELPGDQAPVDAALDAPSTAAESFAA